MNTLLEKDRRPALGIRATRTSPVIVATDGQAQSDGALAVGNLLVDGPEALQVVSVLRRMPVVPDVGVAMSAEIEQLRRADLRRDANAQTTRLVGDLVEAEVHEGDPAVTVARIAHERSASMIVCGLGRHDVVDRILGDETALRLVRLADVPVLAIAEPLERAPATVVVASDFSETSLRAARTSVALVAPGATIYLVHVAPRDHRRHEWEGWGKAYRDDALDALNRMKQELRPEDKAIVQTIMLQGDIAVELLRFARSVHADLIATGSHGHGFVTRMLVGSVATRIVRAATCSVLTVPHAAVLTDERTKVLPTSGRTVPRDDWATALTSFSQRNTGRRTLLEVDDAELGAQAQEFDYKLIGAAFDHYDGRITLMFGDASGAGHQLTRSIAGATSVDVMGQRGGRDLALRVAHGKGQTLLTFVD